MSWISEKAHAELQRVRDAQAKQIYPYFRAFESGGLHTTIGGKPVVNFSSNDYLGLT
ncbi:MAG: 8-amino-7-oxononanoate synthase, partial [Deltaproteobacteria bacterium]|nr:8-amino-7-oxononanoate synthase [Deltaproteobacteria bacterium]